MLFISLIFEYISSAENEATVDMVANNIAIGVLMIGVIQIGVNTAAKFDLI